MFFLTVLEDTQTVENRNAYLDALIQKMAAKDKSALADLYAETHSAVYGFSLSITKNSHDSEDVLQETYLSAWNHAENYRAKGKPMSWLLAIAKNLSLMKLREHKRHQDLEPEEWDAMFHDFDETTNIEDRHLLEAALTILSEEERQIMMLHAVSGLRHREIAELLNMALPTVLSKYHRALKKLREYLEKNF